MAEKFPYLARQMNGPIAKNFGYGFDSVYEQDQEFIDFLSKFSVDNLYGKWLDQLGVVLGILRPYLTIPTVEETFTFDSLAFRLDGHLHGFSSDKNIDMNGESVSRTDGGYLDNLVRELTDFPISDRLYRVYIKSVAEMKGSMSVESIASVIKGLTESNRFSIDFIHDIEQGMVNDVVITLAVSLVDYRESLQRSFDKLFTVVPKVQVNVDIDFDNIHGKDVMEGIIRRVTGGSEDFSITLSSNNDDPIHVFFTVTIGSSISQYADEIKYEISQYFAGINDYVISYNV